MSFLFKQENDQYLSYRLILFSFLNSKIFADNRMKIENGLQNFICDNKTYLINNNLKSEQENRISYENINNYTINNINNVINQPKALSSSLMFKCKVETSDGSIQKSNLKILPYLEAIPTMYAWAPLQKNIMVWFKYIFMLMFESVRLRISISLKNS